jgi:hypothetical protein
VVSKEIQGEMRIAPLSRAVRRRGRMLGCGLARWRRRAVARFPPAESPPSSIYKLVSIALGRSAKSLLSADLVCHAQSDIAEPPRLV